MRDGIAEPPFDPILFSTRPSALDVAQPVSMAPCVSVVVPTYRRPAMLLRCLRALMAQSIAGQDYEIIVVDDAGCALTKRVVDAVARRCGGAPAVQYLVAEHTQGPAAARNLGWLQASHAVIAFTDDDTVPAPDWLQHGMAAMRPSVAAVSGRVVVPIPAPPSDYERDASGLETAEFVCANCFVRRAALMAIGGFDERFTAPWREDSDLQFRLLKRFGGDSHIGHEARALVLHPVRPARWGVSMDQQRKVQFDALLYKKHPALYRARIRRKPRYDYYTIVLLLAVTIVATLAWQFALAGAALAMWLGLTLRFCAERLRGTRHDAAHVLEMLATSAVLPPLAVFWRCVGALRFRVLLV